MKLLKSLIALGLVFSLSTVSFAQDNPAATPAKKIRKKEMSAEQIADNQTKKMTKTLKLTSEQQTKVHEINMKYATQRKDVRGSVTQSKTVKAKLKEIGDNHTAEVRGILNEEQLATYDEIMNKRQDKKAAKKAAKKQRAEQERNPAESAKNRTAKLKKELSLTTEQEKQVMQLSLDFFTAKKAAKVEIEDKKERNVAIKEARTIYREKMSAILTEEQVAKWKANKASKSKKNKK